MIIIKKYYLVFIFVFKYTFGYNCKFYQNYFRLVLVTSHFKSNDLLVIFLFSNNFLKYFILNSH